VLPDKIFEPLLGDIDLPVLDHLGATLSTSDARGERRAKRVRSSELFAADPCDLATLRGRQRCE
jgi:hypothetical protein